MADAVEGFQPATILPTLPAELWLKAFEHLSLNDISRILKVNTYLRKIAQPLAYRYGVFTQFGPAFPGADIPLPFFRNPSTSLPRLTEEEQHHLASRIRRLDVNVHSSEMCRAFHFLMRNRLKFDLDVLNMSVKGYRWARDDDFWE